MVWGRDRKKWQSLEAGDVADALLQMKPDEARKALKEIKSGKVPGFTPKEQRKIEADYKRASEGEKGISALLAGLKGGGSGSKNYANLPLRERVHPAEYKRILEREAKKQGLI